MVAYRMNPVQLTPAEHGWRARGTITFGEEIKEAVVPIVAWALMEELKVLGDPELEEDWLYVGNPTFHTEGYDRAPKPPRSVEPVVVVGDEVGPTSELRRHGTFSFETTLAPGEADDAEEV